MALSIDVSGIKIKIDLQDPKDVNTDEWYAVIDENYQPNKDQFILEKFNKDYPKYDIKDIKLLYNLVSRSKNLQEWLAIATAEFILNVECPEYFKEVLTDEEFNKTNKNISQLNKLYSEKSEKEKRLAEDYKNSRIKLDNEYEDKFNNIKKDNYTKILALKSEELPLEIQMMIEAYTPSNVNDINSKKRYAKELIIKYKLNLLRICKENDIKDINVVIKELSKL